MKKKEKKINFDEDLADNSEKSEVFADAADEDYELLNRDEAKILNASNSKGVDRSTLDPYDQSDSAKAKRYAKKNKGKVAFVAITLSLLAAILISIPFIIFFATKDKPSTNAYTVTIDGNDKEAYEISYAEATKYGEFYFDLASIAKYADLIESGSEGTRKFTCKDGTYVRFTDGSSVAKVNGESVKVGGKAHIFNATKSQESRCLVPFKFIEKLFSHKAEGYPQVGLYVKVSDKNNVTIRRYTTKEGMKLPVSFSSDCFEYANEMQMHSYPNENIDEITAAAICHNNTLLVNPSHPLKKESISCEKLKPLKEKDLDMFYYLKSENNRDYLDPIVSLALIAMINAANETLDENDKLYVSSAYRSYDYQEGLHKRYRDNYMKEHGVSEEEAEAQISLFSAVAGASEHHTGLCVDVVHKSGAERELNQSFDQTPAYEWLSKNAYKYGFILRYPKDKTDITKYDYEPWHYRFVGLEAATIIYEDGITLEEYLGKI